jgi:hypothetical protein
MSLIYAEGVQLKICDLLTLAMKGGKLLAAHSFLHYHSLIGG